MRLQHRNSDDLAAWKPGAISEAERAERARPVYEPRVHVCLGCGRLQDQDDMIQHSGSWVCGEECAVEFNLRVIREIRRDAVRQVHHLHRENRMLRKAR